jgi:hypothetical protein
MKITYYRSHELKNTETLEADCIFGSMEPDEITNEDRVDILEGNITPMCNFMADKVWHCVPWQFVIRIED